MGRPRVHRIFPIALSVESAATALDVRSTRQKSSPRQAGLENKSTASQSLAARRRAQCRLPRLREASKDKERHMPLIEVHLIDKVFNPEQKRQIIQKLTDAMVSIEGENMQIGRAHV